MAAHKLTRWQKASALVPMAVLVGAWGAALTNTSLATAASSLNTSEIPDVPSTPFDQPASVQQTAPSGIDTRAGASNAVASLSTNGIPSASLLAYHRAESLLDRADPACNLSWSLLAAIGRVESNHGRFGGNTVSADGVSTPGIFGIALDGNNDTAMIRDTDNGNIDNDGVWDRAVGPMQFIPETWKAVAIDADGDGVKNTQDVDDAAAAAGVYLCAGPGDLSTEQDARSAVRRYNQSSSYVDLVLQIASQYAQGQFTQSPNGFTSPTILTSRTIDQTLSSLERAKAADEKAADEKDGESTNDKATGEPSADATPTPDTPTATPDKKPQAPDNSADDNGQSTLGSKVQDSMEGTPLAPVTKPLTDLLSTVEANLKCNLKYPLLIHPQAKRDACVFELTH